MSAAGACTLPQALQKGLPADREVPHDQQAALTDWGSTVCIGNLRRAGGVHYAEKDDPQPQDRLEFGLMKLKPWRMSVSS